MPVFILVLIWTLASIILNISGVGGFATWDITARPWHWSCCCILWLYLCFVAIVVAVVTGLKTYEHMCKKRILNSYAPEQREFIRQMMNKFNR